MSGDYDVLIIGAGASGLMCAAAAAARGRRTLLIDHGHQAGRKILIAGGGKCNFTNNEVGPEHYISGNPHFCKSALSRFTQWDFLSLVEKHRISWEEREYGRLFALNSAREIRDMLQDEALSAGAELKTGVGIHTVRKTSEMEFEVVCARGTFRSKALVVATGGLSYPSSGASPLGYRIAGQFGLKVRQTSPGLVPFTFNSEDKAKYSPLSGIAADAEISTGDITFRENLLFSHRGISGPGVLQVSNYWKPGAEVRINLMPGESAALLLESGRTVSPEMSVKGLLSRRLPRRLLDIFIPPSLAGKTLKSLNAAETSGISDLINDWRIMPNGTEGSRKAEVTLGGVDVDGISSKTFEAQSVPGLYFIGEVLDVTGQLGGYNFQWAWSSGWCAGQYV